MANTLTNFNNLRVGRRYYVQNPRQNGWFEGTFVGHMPQGSGIRTGLARFNEIITDREGYDEIEEDGNLSLYFPRTHTFQDLFMPVIQKGRDLTSAKRVGLAKNLPEDVEGIMGQFLTGKKGTTGSQMDQLQQDIGVPMAPRPSGRPTGGRPTKKSKRRARKTRRRHK
jgi:hypothetical protein